MGLFNLFKKKKWEGLKCKPQAIIQLMEECIRINAPIVRLMIEYDNRIYKVGITSDFNGKRGFFDLVYYLQEQIYYCMEEFLEKANINGLKFIELGTVVVLEDEDIGNPRNYPLLTENEIV